MQCDVNYCETHITKEDMYDLRSGDELFFIDPRSQSARNNLPVSHEEVIKAIDHTIVHVDCTVGMEAIRIKEFKYGALVPRCFHMIFEQISDDEFEAVFK